MQAASPKCASGPASRSTAVACSSCSRHSDRARPAGVGGRRRDRHSRLAGQPQRALAYAAGPARRAAAERARGRIGARRRPLAHRLCVLLRRRPQRPAGTGSPGLAAGGAWTAVDVAEADRRPRRGTRARGRARARRRLRRRGRGTRRDLRLQRSPPRRRPRDHLARDAAAPRPHPRARALPDRRDLRRRARRGDRARHRRRRRRRRGRRGLRREAPPRCSQRARRHEAAPARAARLRGPGASLAGDVRGRGGCRGDGRVRGEAAASLGDVIRIANCSGFYGDRLAAAREMVEGGPIDVLTGDYLAELTMLILWKNLQSGRGGYARTFLRQLEDVLGTCAERGIRIVTNAGGLDPAGLAEKVRELAERLGVRVRVAYVEGDDLRSRFPEAVTANAYLGCWGIVGALEAGADVVVCPRVTDASLVVGPAAWKHGWARDDWDALAGAVVAGHVLECGAQATGGNYAFFTEVPGLAHPGFPLAEVHNDGSATITKHPGTGGLVSVGTVTAQLLYELGPPAYANPDVVARFDTARLETSLRERLGGVDLDVQLVRSDKEDAATNAEACAQLRVVARGPDAEQVGRAFSGAAVELALASYPGFTATAPPGDASPYGVFRAAFVPRDAVEETVVLDDGTRRAVAARAPETAAAVNHNPPEVPPAPDGPTRRAPLGLAFGARSGDKGGDANVGVWARSAAGYAWLERFLDVPRFKQLVAEAEPLTVRRYELPNLLALNFVVEGLLGEGVAASTRFDPQAKTLGEYLRSRYVDLPEALL